MSRYQDKRDPRDPGQNQRRKKGSAVGTFFTTLFLFAAIGVFCFAGWKLLGFYMDYKVGTDEYNKLEDQYVKIVEEDDDTRTDASSGQTPAGTAESSGEETPQSEAAAAEQTAEYVPQEHGQTGKSGRILKNVETLEDPLTLEEKVEEAAAVDTEENREKKQLPLMYNPIDFDELNEINPEVIGWIRIGALDRSYPVAQAKDNDFYLHRTFEKKDNFAGCIFLNCDNSRYFSDQNSIVYGHNMKNGSMFGTLKNFRDQKTYDKNPYFWIFTPKFIYQYQIFSCATVSKIGDPYRTRFLTNDYEEFLKTCVEKSEVDTHGLTPTVKDRIVTLSTCTGNESTRFIVQGMLRKIYLSVQGADKE